MAASNAPGPHTGCFFFLCTDGGVLRTVNDVYESHVDFLRPAIPRIERLANDTPARKSPRFASRSDRGETRAEFAQDLRQRVAESLQVAGFRFTIALLAPFVAPRPRDREAMCVVQIAFLFGDDRCLTKATRMDPTDSGWPSKTARGLLRELSIAAEKGQQSPLINHCRGWIGISLAKSATSFRFFLRIQIRSSPQRSQTTPHDEDSTLVRAVIPCLMRPLWKRMCTCFFLLRGPVC